MTVSVLTLCFVVINNVLFNLKKCLDRFYEHFAPHLEMSPKRFTMTTTALFSVSERTHCALVVCDSE